MNRFFALLFLLAVSLPNCLFAQVDDVAQADEIIRIEISSHGEIRYEKIIEIIKLVNTEGADHISFSASEAPGISVSIQSNKPEDQFAALEKSLREIGVESFEVLPLQIDWKEFSLETLDADRKGKGVFVFVRADWCLTCQMLETKTLANDELIQQIVSAKIPFMKADITGGEDAKAIVKRLGVRVAPTFMYFPANVNAAPAVASDLIEVEQISEFILENVPRG